MTNRTDTQGGAMTLEKGLAAFLDVLLGKNRSKGTLRAYRTDVLQFIAFLQENNVAITGVADVGKVDVLEYLAAVARKGLTDVARARKVSAIREYFRFLEGIGVIQKSPATGIDTPKRERNTRQNLMNLPSWSSTKVSAFALSFFKYPSTTLGDLTHSSPGWS